MEAVVEVYVSYGQICVFASTVQQPFNDWTDRHVEQGFAWRPGSVSFRTMIEAGPHSIEVDLVEKLSKVDRDAVRTIEVPFEVPPGAQVEVGSISETVPISLPTGLFHLRCEFLQSASPQVERVRLTFSKSDVPHFAVTRVDSNLRVGHDLLTSAAPALR